MREGQHEGVISLETFQKIQERLNGKPVTPARADINEDFPLRGFVACGCCNHPMTANWAKGRNKSYPYYVCRHRGCEKFGKSGTSVIRLLTRASNALRAFSALAHAASCLTNQ